MSRPATATGPLLVARTAIVKPCWSLRPPESVTRTVTLVLPTWPSVGVQAIRPVLASIVIPAGAVGSEKVRVSPASGLLAVTG